MKIINNDLADAGGPITEYEPVCLNLSIIEISPLNLQNQ
jgi:hypothetical protein